MRINRRRRCIPAAAACCAAGVLLVAVRFRSSDAPSTVAAAANHQQEARGRPLVTSGRTTTLLSSFSTPSSSSSRTRQLQTSSYTAGVAVPPPITCDWKQIGDDLDGAREGDQRGASVAFARDGTTVAVGAPGGLFTSLATPGRVRIYSVVARNSGSDDENGDGDETASNNGGAAAELVQLGSTIDGEVSGDEAGGSVALSDDGRTVAIGSNRNDDTAMNAGQARVYKYDAALEDWTQVGQDLEGEAAKDYSGVAVAINADGTIVAVAAPGNDGPDDITLEDSLRGHVRVYQLVEIDSENRWVQMGPDIEGFARGDELGSSVALSADGLVLLAGAPRTDAGEQTDSGEVVVFRYENSVWNPVGSRLAGEQAGDWFGVDVSISAGGDIIAAGAWLNDDNGPFSGHARVFSLVDGEWQQLGNTIVGESSEDQAGHSVSLSSDGLTVAVGAIRNDGGNGSDSGHVRVFTLNDNTWIQIGSDLDGEAADDSFGTSTSISGDGASLIVGGLKNDNDAGIDAGSARVFTLDLPCPELEEARIDEITLELRGVGELNPIEIADFEQITQTWYENFYALDDTKRRVGVRNLGTTVAVQSQKVENGAITINTLTYEQNFTFVEQSGPIKVNDLLVRPFEDAAQGQVYGELLAESIPPFGSVQSPLGPPTVVMEGGPDPSQSGTSGDGLSVGAIAGIAAAALFLGLVVAGVLFRRHIKGIRQPEDISDLPVGELIDTADYHAPSPTTRAVIQAITVDIVDDGGNGGEAPPARLPTFKDQAHDPTERIIPSESSENLEETVKDDDKDDFPLDYKDQVRPYRLRSANNHPEDRRPEDRPPLPREQEPDVRFKDQVESVD